MRHEGDASAHGVVVDANVVAKWFLNEADSDDARRVLRSESVLVAPDLLIPELGSIFREKVRSRELTTQDSAKAIEIVLERVLLVTSEDAFNVALEICTTASVSFYDALYVALARNLGVELVTADERLIRALGSEFTGVLRPLPAYEPEA